MQVDYDPKARLRVLEALSEVVAINPDLAAGVIVFVQMIDGSVITLHTSCCPTHASVVCEAGLSQIAQVVGWDCPREG